MRFYDFARAAASLVGLLALLAITPAAALAHCDGVDGPVVAAARQALDAGNVNLVLLWVQPAGEPEVRAAFDHALAVRKLGSGAKELADRYFFETVVRVHRAGEGAPYTGLKPAGRDLGPAIPAADHAIEHGSATQLRELLMRSLDAGLQERFRSVTAAKDFRAGDVDAGRRFVKAYVEFVHYVEGVSQASAGPASPHEHNAPEPAHAHN